ncbi:MAG: UDP-GlcNAc:undecaprenyl-phosphate GlcNAc-1-phosphate transferase [Phenylobacterium sp.]|jgi:UDP-GlcNAc:undecaprenyl-phosphate GlcNAc-1-phosphate transferase
MSIISTIVAILLLSRLASTIGLVDIPDGRKSHIGQIPLIGGMAIVASMAVMVWLFGIEWPFNTVVTALAFLLFLFGLVDDRMDLSPRLRFFVQVGVAVLTIYAGDLHLYYFGNIFYVGDFYLGFWGELLTGLAIVTAINAFNMIDGIDGLLALLLINVFVCIGIIGDGLSEFEITSIILLAVFLLFNLGLLTSKRDCRKVFMGDAGSMMFGYLVVCLLIDKSQQPAVEIRPVTVLWMIAIPLMDLVAIVIRRIRKKQPVMKADRDHLHHIFIRIGFSDLSALVVILGVAAVFSAVGIISEIMQLSEFVMFISFISIFLVYLYFILHAWKFVRLFNVLQNRGGHE